MQMRKLVVTVRKIGRMSRELNTDERGKDQKR